MEIRKKLALQFINTVALILLLSSAGIYFSFAGTRKDDFFNRLSSKATMVAKMLVEIEEIDVELLTRIEKDNPLSLPNERIIIYNYLNQVIYSSDSGSSLNITEDMINEVRLNGELKAKQGQYEIHGQYYTSQYDRFVVFAAAFDIFGMKKLRLLRIILLTVFSLSLAIVFFLGNLLAKQALKPVSEIMTQVNAISGSNLNTRISEGNGKDELSRLAMTFNKMLDRIETGFNTQKSFITNASHELRTPLTAITLQLDVILMNARSNEEYRNTLLSVLADMRNLNLIANRLLLLAQASSEINESSFIQLRIDDLLWQARKEVIKRDPGYRISVFFSESIDNDRELIVRGSELLLKTAVGNLMENSCKYSRNQTSEVFLDSTGDHLCIRFSDTGIGIPPEDIDNIFQPFYRARNAMSYKGHGIGLSLAKTIIHQHRGTIDVQSELNSGTVFQIYLKSSG